MPKQKKKFDRGPVFLLGLALLFCLALGALYRWLQDQSSKRLAQAPPSFLAYAKKEKEEAYDLKQFRAQKKRDELVKLTENSFFDPSLRPLEGRPVLLATGVETWNHNASEKDETPNLVKFEIVRGKGTLETFTDYIPGQPAPSVPHHDLETLAMDGYEAFAWLRTDPASTEETVVRAVLVAEGERAAFIDPQSEVTFRVDPVGMPGSFKEPDILQLAQSEFHNRSRPHAEVANRFIFHYPGSQGVFTFDQQASWTAKDRMVLFHKDEKGTVSEGHPSEEKDDFRLSHEKWRFAPPDLKGLVTHVEVEGSRFGLLSYSQDDPGYKAQGGDHFQPARWEFGEYSLAELDAGPEDLSTLTTGQEDPDSPVVAEVSKIHRSHLKNQDGVPYWGETANWVCSTTGFHTIFGLEILERLFYGRVPSVGLADLKKQLGETPLPPSEPLDGKIVDDFFKTLGFSFRDITPDMESRFHQLGHPPGPMVVKVDPQSPAAVLGLMPDDVIVMADWERTPSAVKLQGILKGENASSPLRVFYWRQGVYFQSQVNRPLNNE